MRLPFLPRDEKNEEKDKHDGSDTDDVVIPMRRTQTNLLIALLLLVMMLPSAAGSGGISGVTIGDLDTAGLASNYEFSTGTWQTVDVDLSNYPKEIAKVELDIHLKNGCGPDVLADDGFHTQNCYSWVHEVDGGLWWSLYPEGGHNKFISTERSTTNANGSTLADRFTFIVGLDHGAPSGAWNVTVRVHNPDGNIDLIGVEGLTVTKSNAGIKLQAPDFHFFATPFESENGIEAQPDEYFRVTNQGNIPATLSISFRDKVFGTHVSNRTTILQPGQTTRHDLTIDADEWPPGIIEDIAYVTLTPANTLTAEDSFNVIPTFQSTFKVIVKVGRSGEFVMVNPGEDITFDYPQFLNVNYKDNVEFSVYLFGNGTVDLEVTTENLQFFGIKDPIGTAEFPYLSPESSNRYVYRNVKLDPSREKKYTLNVVANDDVAYSNINSPIVFGKVNFAFLSGGTDEFTTQVWVHNFRATTPVTSDPPSEDMWTSVIFLFVLLGLVFGPQVLRGRFMKGHDEDMDDDEEGQRNRGTPEMDELTREFTGGRRSRDRGKKRGRSRNRGGASGGAP